MEAGGGSPSPTEGGDSFHCICPDATETAGWQDGSPHIDFQRGPVSCQPSRRCCGRLTAHKPQNTTDSPFTGFPAKRAKKKEDLQRVLLACLASYQTDIGRTSCKDRPVRRGSCLIRLYYRCNVRERGCRCGFQPLMWEWRCCRPRFRPKHIPRNGNITSGASGRGSTASRAMQRASIRCPYNGNATVAETLRPGARARRCRSVAVK